MEQQTESATRGGKTSLRGAIRRRQREGLFPVIAEIKVRSEKEGDLLRGRDPVELARLMASCPVAGISVVTEPEHFGGSMDLLRAVAAAVDSPTLHKDFITRKGQVDESVACGASAILLIAEMLSEKELLQLIDEARRNGLETLVEAHSTETFRVIERLSADLLGINNRDITILEVDDGTVERTEELSLLYTGGRPLISESSLSTPDEVRRAGRSGADAVLVGTAILKAEETTDLLSALISVGWPP